MFSRFHSENLKMIFWIDLVLLSGFWVFGFSNPNGMEKILVPLLLFFYLQLFYSIFVMEQVSWVCLVAAQVTPLLITSPGSQTTIISKQVTLLPLLTSRELQLLLFPSDSSQTLKVASVISYLWGRTCPRFWFEPHSFIETMIARISLQHFVSLWGGVSLVLLISEPKILGLKSWFGRSTRILFRFACLRLKEEAFRLSPL